MGTATRKLGDGPNNQGWLVRNEQGETFGPVDFETLKAWACDGRLAPANEISEDGAEWQLATANRALDMSWVAEVSPGTFYGPIHKQAMEELVRDGSIAGASAFFARRSLDGKAEPGPDPAQAERIRSLTEQYAQVQQQLAGAEAQAREARRAAAEREEQLREARRLTSEAEERLQAAVRRSDELAAQARQAQAQADLARGQAESCEKQLRAQLAEQEAQAQRRVAAYEEQVRLAQQQACAYAEQVEQVRRQSAESEERLRESARQLAEQAEQARAVQQVWLAKAEGLSEELEALRKTHASCLAKAAEAGAEHAAERASRDAREGALEAERKSLAASLAQARTEIDAQKARLLRLEAERRGIEAAASEQGELGGRLHAVCAELSGVQQALACEREAAQQAQARCATLESALREAQAQRGEQGALSDRVCDELRQMRAQIDALGALFQREQEAREASARREERAAARPVERVYVEAEPVDVLPPESRAKGKKAHSGEAHRTDPEPPPKPQPTAAPPGRTGGGLSLAELEQQARRELERLGAQGANLFKRK